MSKRARIIPGLRTDEAGEPVLEAGRVTRRADLAKVTRRIRELGSRCSDERVLLRVGGRPELDDRDGRVVEAALKTAKGQALLADLVRAVGEVNREHAVLWWDDERHAADRVALALALRSSAYLPLFADYLRSNDLDHEVEQGAHLDRVIEAYGWCAETLALAALRATEGAGQHGHEQVARWAAAGLGQILREDHGLAEVFVEACHAEALASRSYHDFRCRLTPGDGEQERFARLLSSTLELRYEPVARAIELVLGADSPWAARLRDERGAEQERLTEAGARARALCRELEALAAKQRWREMAALRGRIAGARPLASRALANLSLALMHIEPPAVVADVCADSLEDTPVHPALLSNALKACADAGDAARGISLWERARARLESFTGDGWQATILGKLIACYWFADRKDEGFEQLDPQIRALRDERDPTFLLNAACLYVWKGDTERALDVVRRGLAAGIAVSAYEADDGFDPIRALPAFERLLAEHR